MLRKEYAYTYHTTEREGGNGKNSTFVGGNVQAGEGICVELKGGIYVELKDNCF